MYFALLIRADGEQMAHQPSSVLADIEARVEAFDALITAEQRNAGSLRLGNTGVRVLRMRNGRPFLTDGPFAESKEQLGGIYLIEADDIDHASTLAEELVMGFGSIEIRPLIGIDLRGELQVQPGD